MIGVSEANVFLGKLRDSSYTRSFRLYGIYNVESNQVAAKTWKDTNGTHNLVFENETAYENRDFSALGNCKCRTRNDGACFRAQLDAFADQQN